jgi:hypothetical protein
MQPTEKSMTKKSLLWRRETDNIEDILKFIETSYGIEFRTNELKNIETFGELTDRIISKIKLQDIDDNTDQQGFYKLKGSIEKIRGEKNLPIQLNTKLTNIFPRKNRCKEILEIEKMLEIRLKPFRPTHFETAINLTFFLIVAFCFMFDWKIGLVGLAISLIGSWTVDKKAKIFIDMTFGELLERMIIYNYIKSRQNPLTVNKKEIEGKLKRLFVDNWALKDGDIGRETIIM